VSIKRRRAPAAGHGGHRGLVRVRRRMGWHILSAMPSAKKKIASRRKPVDAAVGTLERGLAILQFFKSEPEASVAEVAAALGLSRSTTYRIAERLRDLGFLEANAATARWRLGRETVQLGVAALQSTDLMRVAPQILLGLLEGTREAVNLAVFDADSMVLVYREQGPQSVTISSRLGSRRPIHASGLGKAYLAALRAEERQALIERLDLKRFTPETLVNRTALERGVVEIQKRGFADDRREFEQTLACCAAAVFDHRSVPVAAISVSGPADRILAKFDRIGAEVAVAARAISERLGYIYDPKSKVARS
jgi:IclR family acetate operon transcriptional repressor